MNVPDVRASGKPKTLRRLRRVLWMVVPLVAFCVWALRPSPPPSTAISRMMAEALPEAASVAKRWDAAEAHELSFIKSFAGPDDWVCFFLDYESVVERVRRDTGRTVSANIARADDRRAWALVIGDQAHVMLIWTVYVRDRRTGTQLIRHPRCTRIAETRVLKQGAHLLLEDAD